MYDVRLVRGYEQVWLLFRFPVESQWGHMVHCGKNV